ncbi:MAG: NADPH-dependent 2,4-dienoyl-CoA reductase, partial [SAR324 cluster bacterium]
EEINTCIACNQACLDHVFSMKRATCLVNPRACYETELNYLPTSHKKRIAVVGAGPAGLACADTSALRGHEVHLFEAAGEIGGQFNIAKQVPGKEEFSETLRYFKRQLQLNKVNVHLNKSITAKELIDQGFDEIILATGVVPRQPPIPGVDHAKVLSYIEVLLEKKPVGKSVAIIGAGGIGFDVAEYLTHAGKSPSLDQDKFLKEWGIDQNLEARGGVDGCDQAIEASPRQVYLLQRKTSKLGKGLGKTTGWIHRTTLKNKKVTMISGASYDKIDQQGLHITVNDQQKLLSVDHVILCTGQESRRDLQAELESAGMATHLIGGAKLAGELDAKRAISDGCRLAASL